MAGESEEEEGGGGGGRGGDGWEVSESSGIKVVKVVLSRLLIRGRGVCRFLAGIPSSWHLQSASEERSMIEIKG